jgi:integrase
MKSFFNECNNPYWKRIAEGLYYTGTRAGELIQIQSQHIKDSEDDSEFLKIKINTEKNPHAPIRYIPIFKIKEPQTLDIFTISPNPNDYCFPSPKPSLATSSYLRYMRKEFNKTWRGIAPHYFRHCRLTHMVTEFDFNDQELVKYAGWTDSTPAKWYMSLKTTDLERKMKVK